MTWTQLATRYLACGFGGVFFNPPATETEIKYNVSAYDRLQETQKAALAEFLRQNKGILEELAQLLAAKRRLTLQDMRPLFDNVQFTPAIPRVHIDTILSKITHQTVPASLGVTAV